MYNEKEVMRIVNNICNMKSTDCRSLNKVTEARKLMNMLNVPQDAKIYEIPVDWDNQVVVSFEFRVNGKNETNEGFEVYAGLNNEEEFCLSINRVAFEEDGYLVEDENGNTICEELDLDYFKKGVIV